MPVDTVQPAIDFNARFGGPRIERYRIDERLRLSVQYGVGGRIEAIEIAPVDYRGFNPLQPPEMLSQIADGILEKLFPEITINGLVRETTVESTYPGFSREIRTLPGTSLIRDYPLGADRSKMIAAGLEVSSADLWSTLREVVSPLGAPEYQQFAADSGLAVGAYQTSIRQIVISAEESLLAHSDYARPIGRDAAERLLTELLPSSASTEEPGRSVFCAGAYKSERSHFSEFLLCRNYVNDDMIGISIGWPAANLDEQSSC